jgi:hypothetical protein
MSGNEPSGGPPAQGRPSRRFSRRELIALGAAGALVLGGGGVAFGEQQRRGRKSGGAVQADGEEAYKGRKIKVKKEKGRDELYIDDEHVNIVRTNGAFRAEGYMFDPKDDAKGLAKAMIDAHEKLKAKGIEDPEIF